MGTDSLPHRARPVSEEAGWRGRDASWWLAATVQGKVNTTRLLLLIIAGIAVHPAEAKEHTRPGGEDTAAGSGQRREDHPAKTAGI